MATTHPHQPLREHDTASLGAVVTAGVILVALLVGAAVLVAQVVDVVIWSFTTT
ncbi:hypothetical protein [Cellulomonas sp. PhB150]|uniref:hypothetical protein n=1 Tax=Cellulomonas sp. PhB150 TaxID=2485188 RepID=UPI0018F69CD5|nr:hypothetical protein [Cellulomonas sp. PhB150]